MIFLPSLKLTASLHLKIDGWKTTFVLGWPIFRGYVSFKECKYSSYFILCGEFGGLAYLAADCFSQVSHLPLLSVDSEFVEIYIL